MSISVTVSGQDSTSVVSAQPLSNTITVSGISSEIEVTRASQNAATITVSTGDPITVTSNRNSELGKSLSSVFNVTGDLDSKVTNLITATGVLSIATGNLDSKFLELSGAIATDEASLIPLNTATGVLKTATGVLSAQTGLYALIGANVSFKSVDITGNSLFVGSAINESNITTKGPGSVNYVFNTHANGFKFIDGDGGGGTIIDVPHPFINNDGSRNQIGLIDTAVQGGFFTSSGMQHIADTDTAFKFPGTNTVSIDTSGAERLRVNRFGNVGIGTTEPREKLEISGKVFIQETGRSASIVVNRADGKSIGIVAANKESAILYDTSTGDGCLSFQAQPSHVISSGVGRLGQFEVARIDGVSGNFGIGTRSPQAKLHVSGNAIISGDFTVTSNTNLSGNASITGRLGVGTGLFDRMVHIRSSTNDEYGQHPLRVEGPNAGTAGERSSIIEIKAGDNASFAGIDFGHNTAAHPGSIVYNHSNNNLFFDTNDATRLTIDDAGRVGIGTSDPIAKLHISGDTLLSGNATISGLLTLPLTNQGIKFGPGNTESDDAHIEYRGGPNAGFLRISVSDDQDIAGGGKEFIELGDYEFPNRGGTFERHVKICRTGFSVSTAPEPNSPIDRFIIDASGNVGIGRSALSPDRLTVDGDIRCSGLDINAGSNNEFIQFRRSVNDSTKTVGFIKNTDGKLTINAGGDVDELLLQVDGTDAFNITKSSADTFVRVIDNLIIGDNFFKRVNVSTATGLLRDATGLLNIATGNLDSKLKEISGVVDNTINVGATGAILSNNLATTGATLSTNLATTGATLSSNLAITGATLSSNLAITGATLSGNLEVLELKMGANTDEIIELSGLVINENSILTTNLATTGATLSSDLSTTGFLLSTATGIIKSSITVLENSINTNLINLAATGATLSTATGVLKNSITDNATNLGAATGLLSTATGILKVRQDAVLNLETGLFAEQQRDAEFAKITTTESMFITAPNSDVGLNIKTPPNKEAFLNFGDFDNISGGVIRYKNPSDSFHFRTSGSDALNINASGDVDIFGKVGVGVELPKAKLHVDGDTILSGNAIITGRILVGTGVLSPDAQLHVRSTDQVILKLEADTDNTNEDHNPLIQFIQDGGSISSNFGFNGATNTQFTNAIADSFYIENKSSNSSSQNIQFATNNKAQVTITDDDKVGIGTHDPLAKLHVSGNTILSGVLTVTGDIDSPSITSLNTATGDLRNNLLIVSGLIVSNDADLTALNTATGVLKNSITANTTNLGAATGLLSIATGVLKTSINDNVINLGSTGSTLSTATGVLKNSIADNVTNLQSSITALENSTGVLNTDVLALQAVTGSFALTGSSTFGLLNVTGNVGIGTTSPQAKFHVNGDTILSGHVGIGTSPQFPLDINGTNSTTGSTIRLAQNNGGTAIRIGAGGGSSDVVLMRIDGQTQDDKHDGITDSAAFGFSMKYMGSLAGNDNALRIISDNQQGTPVNALNIQQDGSIGLNTGSPQARLHVLGTTLLNGTTEINGTDFFVKDGNEDHLRVNRGGLYLYQLGDISGAENKSFLEIDSTNAVSTLHNSSLKMTEQFECKGLVTSGLTTLSGDAFITGRVGIGTNSPQAKLHVSGDAIVSGSLTVNHKIKIGTGVAIGPLQVFNTGNTDMTLARFENSSSTSNDHDANVEIISKGQGESTLQFRNPDVTKHKGFQIGFGHAQNGNLFFRNAHVPRVDMAITQDGNIGMGTTSTTRRLAVHSTAASNLVIVSPTDNISHIGLGDTDDDNYGQIILDNSVNKLQIQNGGGAAISDRGITLDSSENVGIGTASPSSKFHVAGTTLLSGDISVTGNIITTGSIASNGTITSTSSVSRPVQNDEANDTTPIRNIRNITQSGYNTLTGSSNEDANTLYIIVG